MFAFLLPMFFGLGIIWAFDGRLWAWPYLLLIGLTSGIGFTAVTALWAEIYGVRHIGTIRSLVISFSVFASALGPLAMGVLMDFGVSVESVCGLFAVYAMAATGSMHLGLRGLDRRGVSAEP